MKVSCIDATTTHVKGSIIGKIVDDIKPSGFSPSGQVFPPTQLQKLQSIDDTTKVDTSSQIELDPFHLINLVAFSGTNLCERHNTFISELAGSLGGVGVKECKPIGNPISGFTNSEWKECECIVYVRIKGGKERVVKDLEQRDDVN